MLAAGAVETGKQKEEQGGRETTPNLLPPRNGHKQGHFLSFCFSLWYVCEATL